MYEKPDLSNIKSEEEKIKILEDYNQKIDNDILFYAFNKSGELSIKSPGTEVKKLAVLNPDFVVVTDLSESILQKKKSKDLSDIMKLIKKRGFIIKFEC